MSLQAFSDRIRDAADRRLALQFRGGGSKDFYGNQRRGEIIDTRAYAGITDYEPSELVITARCGTPLAEVERVLAERGQCLPFEPPHFGAATFGGCVASGLSGPRRAAAGAVRDFVLGVKLIDGRGRVMQFGGQVMKNVAGYDVSRLMAGSLGTLGLIAEASVKVLPRAPLEMTLRLEMDEAGALDAMNRWAGEPLPVSATAWHAGVLDVRLSGSEPAVRGAMKRIGGVEVPGEWETIREQTHPFFAGDAPLWRLSLPSTAAPVGRPQLIAQLIEWGGALRWIRDGDAPRDVAKRAGGHATLFRGADKSAGAFTPLDPALTRLHRQLKSAFDPGGILNPGRLYPEL